MNDWTIEFPVIAGKMHQDILLFISVIGCADLKDIDGADIVRSKDVSTVTCRDKTQRSWTLSCNSTTGEWAGLHAVCEGRIKNQNTMITILELVFI